MKTALLIPLLVAPPALAFGLNLWVIRSAPELPPMGVEGGALLPCPANVECVSSEDEAQEPLAFEGDADTALVAMVDFLRSESGAEYVDVSGDYLHAVFARPYLDIVEHVELLLDREASCFHLRAFEQTASPASTVANRAKGLSERWRLRHGQMMRAYAASE